MSEHNDNYRDDIEITVPEYLEQMGITAAVENFLSDDKTNNLLQDIHATSFQGIGAKIKTLPAGIQDDLNEWLEHFEGQYDGFIEVVLGRFRQEVANRMYVSTELMDETAALKVAAAYQETLETRSKSLEQLLQSIADEVQDEAEQAFIKSWIILLNELETDEDRFALLKAVMGDNIPEGLDVKVVPVYASDIEDAMAQIATMTGLFGCGCGCDDDCGEGE